MTPLTMDLVWRRNAPEPESYTLVDQDPDTGVTGPVDLTGIAMRLQLRLYPGAPGAALVTLGMAAEGSPGIFLDDAAGGSFTVTPPSSAALLALPAQPEADGQPLSLAYDLLLIHIDGVVETFAQGRVALPMGVTI